ncbi:hypothetical protein [Luteimonas saliphila]|uniref:hypothetical protein n=1 Tax=Luteimonas saliphila TaxID=2804919 RepID=UPI00192D5694|nr:hypothetical protein [Luteimonas saliphila]
MKGKLAAFAANPMTYVLGFALCGAVSVVSGVALLAGAGWALVASGAFLLAAAGYITKGLTPNG